MNKVNIFMDDFRDPPYDMFILARTGGECLDFLRDNKGSVNILSLDHDLGDSDQYDGTKVVEQMILEGLYADKIYLHSANPVGRKRMEMALLNAIKHEIIPDHVMVRNGPMA